MSSKLQSSTELPPPHGGGGCVGERDDSPDRDLSLELTASLGGESRAAAAATLEPGGEVATYRINRLLGEGGMGLVYEAEQRSPRRLVALKVMRHGHHVDDVHARLFKHEAETLARLRHPNIAAIYESGHTRDGRDFFAMELVDGPTLEGWLKRFAKPNSRAAISFRLRLFQAICKPVHYAHQRGVVHRDLKPKNIMMVQDSTTEHPVGATRLPTVKILDFGLARITDSDLQGGMETHAAGTIRGTLPYMSPEQARGDVNAIDVRTDVYALGVILYEMLTDRRPYPLSTNSLSRALRVICEVEPEPMWMSGEHTPKIDRELQAIVLKALAKDPDQRYGSVAALDDDVERYLGSIPIAAYSSTRAYRTRKFIDRHRSAVAAAVVLTLAMVLGIAGTTAGLVRARRAEAASRQDAMTSERVSGFLSDMLASVDAQSMGKVLVAELESRVATAADRQGADADGAELAVNTFRAAIHEVSATDTGRRLLDEAILSRAGEAIQTRFADEPEVAGQLEHTLAETYERLGMYDKAIGHAERAVEIRSGQHGGEVPDLLQSQCVLGTLRYRQGEFDAAEQLLADTHEAQRALLGDDHPDSLVTAVSRAWVMIEQGRLVAAEVLLEATLERQRLVLGATHRRTIDSMNSLAVVYTGQRRYAEAEALHSKVLELRSRILGPHDPDTLKSMTNLAVVSFYQGRLGNAADLFAEVLEIQRQRLGPTHPTTLGSANNLAIIYQQQNRLGEAEALLSWVLGEKRQVLGLEHPETLASMHNLAIVFTAQRRYAEAAATHREVFDARGRTLGADHPQTLASQCALAGVAALQGQHELALAYLEAAVEQGYGQADSLVSDADFASLQADPVFQKLVERARANSPG